MSTFNVYNPVGTIIILLLWSVRLYANYEVDTYSGLYNNNIKHYTRAFCILYNLHNIRQ